MTGGMPDRKVQLIHCDRLPFRVTAVCRFQRIHTVAGKISGFTIELRVPLAAQSLGTPHMVIVAVGAQNNGERHMMLFQNSIVGLCICRRVNDDRMACVRDEQKGIGIQRCRTRDMKSLHSVTPFSSTRRCR